MDQLVGLTEEARKLALDDRLVDELLEVEAVEGDLGLRQLPADAPDKGRRHVTGDLLDALAGSAMRPEVLDKRLDGGGILARRPEEHPLRLQIHEDRDVVVPAEPTDKPTKREAPALKRYRNE